MICHFALQDEKFIFKVFGDLSHFLGITGELLIFFLFLDLA